MLDKRKVKLMTRMASYEQNEGKQDIKISAYYRKDYASLHTLFSILWVTVGYVCFIALIGLGSFDTLVDGMSMGLMITLGIIVIAGYFFVVIAYAIAAHHIYNKKHKDARTRVKKYNHDITRLLKMYEKENQ